MATAFSYSGTGLESAIQSGSGGIGTGSPITLEVDAVPSDVSQGDTIKVALGPASDWAAGNGETAYGDIGGAGANGGTNITLTSRGQEGTSAALWSEGDPARVGVSGRDNQRISGMHPPDSQVMHVPYFGSFDRSNTPTQDVIHASWFELATPRTLSEVAFQVTTAGSSPGKIDVRLFHGRVGKKVHPTSDDEIAQIATTWGADTTGTKSNSVSIPLAPGLYYLTYRASGWGTAPEVLANNDFQASANSIFPVGRNTNIGVSNYEPVLFANTTYASLVRSDWKFSTAEVFVRFRVKFTR